MSVRSLFAASASLFALFTPQAFSVSLQQVFEASPKVADFRPGPYALHLTPTEATVRIDGKLWEVRYVTYTDVEGKARLRSLRQLANDYGFEHEEGQDFKANPLVTTTTWVAPDHMKEEGIYYIVSIKQLERNLECIGCENK